MPWKKLGWILGVIVIITAGFLTYKAIANNNGSKIDKNKASLSNSFTGEKPEFTIYYPSSTPKNIKIDKGSIKTARDLFTFNMHENGKQNFAVNEQFAGNDFNFKDFKKKLYSPTEFKSSLGEGVFGGLDASLITAVKTKEDTLIIVNCVSTICIGPSRQIVENMKIVNDVNKL